MKNKFNFIMTNNIATDEENTIFSAELKGDVYVISWVDEKGRLCDSKYHRGVLESKINEGLWLIVKVKESSIFTVKYYNNALDCYNEKSFNKKKEALVFIEALKTLIEIKDIKLFKTKEIPLSK